jgi:hypothetical protein
MTQAQTQSSGHDNPNTVRQAADTEVRSGVPLPVFRGLPSDHAEPPAVRADRAQAQPVFSSAPIPRQAR